MTSRNVLITGASTGIGRATAEYLDGRGYRVFATVRKDKDADALRTLGSERLVPVKLDVTQESSIAAALEELGDTLGQQPLDGLVNNAGVGFGGPTEVLPMERLRALFDVNVFGLVAVTRACMPLLRRSASPRIVNVSSVSGRITSPFVGGYAATKHAVEALTTALRHELVDEGFRISSVQPGMIESAIWDKTWDEAAALDAGLSEEARARYSAAMNARLEKMKVLSAKATPAVQVAKAIDKALSSRRPRRHYLVGTDAKVGVTLERLLPGGLFEWLVRK